MIRRHAHSYSSWSEFLPMVDYAINNSVHASTQPTPFYVNGLRRPRLPTLLECDSLSRGEGIARAKTVLVLDHHVSTLTSSRMMPMATRSTLINKITSIIAATLSLTRMMVTMLIFSAMSTTIPARMASTSLMNRKRKALYLQLTEGELNKITLSQQKDFCWLAKQWSVSYRIPSLTRWTVRNGTLTRMEGQMYIHLSKAT